MPVRFDQRQGDSLLLTFDVTENGVDVDVTAWTITASVKDRYGITTTALTITKDGSITNRFRAQATSGVTATWPAGILEGMVKCVVGTDTLYSQTFEIEVLPAIG